MDNDIRQRKVMAGAAESGNFGVESLAKTNRDGTSMGSANANILPEGKRCPPVKQGGRMSNQAQPDHGKHGNGGWNT